MRGLFFDGAKAMLRDDLPEPQPGAGESLLSIELATVCPED